MWIIPFLFLSLSHLYFEKIHSKKGRILTKPLLMPLLLLFYVTMASDSNLLIILALIFGAFGDLFLLFEKKQEFVLLGIVAFLFGHVCYISFFWNQNIPWWGFLFLIPYLLFGIQLGKKLIPYMENFMIPCSVYMAVLCIMSFTTITSLWISAHFFFSVLGSLFFIVSDIFLSVKLFKNENMSSLPIMVFYLLGQLFLIIGLAQ